MPMIRRAALAFGAVLASTVPAVAQTTTSTPPTGDTGSGLVYVWGWILVVGIIVFVVGTSLGARRGR